MGKNISVSRNYFIIILLTVVILIIYNIEIIIYFVNIN